MLHPIVPREVRMMTPSEVAAELGLDLMEAIRPVPFELAPFVPRNVERVSRPRVRRLA